MTFNFLDILKVSGFWIANNFVSYITKGKYSFSF